MAGVKQQGENDGGSENDGERESEWRERERVTCEQEERSERMNEETLLSLALTTNQWRWLEKKNFQRLVG